MLLQVLRPQTGDDSAIQKRFNRLLKLYRYLDICIFLLGLPFDLKLQVNICTIEILLFDLSRKCCENASTACFRPYQFSGLSS